MIKKLVLWVFSDLLHKLDAMNEALDRTSRFMRDKEELLGRYTKLSLSHKDTLIELNKAKQKYITVESFLRTLEGAGIKRKFGNSIDIDYDKFLNAIGPDDEEELGQVIRDRKRKRKKTNREIKEEGSNPKEHGR